jgi:hypothetical protein
MLQTHAEEPEARSTAAASPRFGHDFSQIPIHPPAAGAIQTKLAINKPGDEYEQEADRISEQVMRMPEPRLQRACACGGACPKFQTEQPGHECERLHTKRVGSDDWGQDSPARFRPAAGRLQSWHEGVDLVRRTLHTPSCRRIRGTRPARASRRHGRGDSGLVL